jgi:hypothetical protein
MLKKARRDRARLHVAIASQEIIEISDALFNFAITVYHVKDWLENEPGIDAAALKAYYDQSRELKVCRDICDSSKHRVLTRVPPIVAGSVAHTAYPTPTVAGPQLAPGLETSEKWVKVTLKDGSKIEATHLVDGAVAAWEAFFRSQGLSCD